MGRTVTALISTGLVAATIAATPTVVRGFDVEQDCFSLDPPQSTSTEILGDAPTIPLAVRVLFDVAEAPAYHALVAKGTDEAAASARAMLDALVDELGDSFERARPAYEPLNIELVLSYDVSSTWDEAASDTRQLIEQGKEHYGGVPPAGIDVVYVATDNRGDGAAGSADCVGGLASDHHSFAAGELYRDRDWDPFPLTPVVFNEGLEVFTFAHEVGHLLGAHHHFSNCAESAPTYPDEVLADATDVCTLMINDNSLGQELFSSVNSVVVRGYAEDFAIGAP